MSQNTCGVNFACDRGFAFNESCCHFDSGQQAERGRRGGAEERERGGEGKRMKRGRNEERKYGWIQVLGEGINLKQLWVLINDTTSQKCPHKLKNTKVT